ncbi:MAG TPA: O-antigen ligase family protein [Gemmatimonadales bacterium]|nr:O-antigen ligase family protein [Gemmatimonadales bacterium]
MPAAPAAMGTAELVREAAAAPGKGRSRGSNAFSLSEGGAAERWIAPFLGLYLGWAVARIPEVFPAVAIPKLPMVLLIVFMVILAVAIPPDAWERVWHESHPLKLVATLAVLSVITAPLGIWFGGSFWFLRNRYVIAVVIFLACLIFLRDRKALRTAVVIFILCVAAIAIYTLMHYDPTADIYDQYGNLVDPSLVSIEQRRVQVSLSLDSNDWGAILATSTPLAVWLSAGSIWRRLFWGAIALLLIAGVVPTSSRGSLLGLIAAGLVLVSVGATGWRRMLMLLLVAGSGLVFSAIATQGELGRFFDFGTDDYNVSGNEGRFYFWRQGMVWMIKRPWGYGIDNFPTYFGWLNGPDRAAHSMWVQYGVELGVLGLVTIITLCWFLFRRLRQWRKAALARRRLAGDVMDKEAILFGHVMAMLTGTLVTGSFLSNAYYPLTYMSLGIAAAALLGSPLRDLLANEQEAGLSAPTSSPSAPVLRGSRPPARRR